MYELLVLALLMHWPLHAYRVAKIANEIIGPEEQISTGTLSSLFTKLERAGLISPADPGTAPFPGAHAGYLVSSRHLSQALSHQGAAPGVFSAREPALPGGALPGPLQAGLALQANGRAGCGRQPPQTRTYECCFTGRGHGAYAAQDRAMAA